MDKLKFIMIFHNHQPVGNFDYVFEKAYNEAYKPFLEIFKKFNLKMNLHISGPLLMWLKKNKPSYIEDISLLIKKGQIEILGSGYSEPILAVIPKNDAMDQILIYKELLSKTFDTSVDGAWLTERVWEPHLPEIFHMAGIKYIIVDDYHFLRSGFDTNELDGYYLTEFENKKVAIYPGSEKLRYFIPFRTVEENIEYFKEIYNKGIKTLIFADDGEKFGIWPETYKWVYEERWLYKFFDFIENSAFLETYTLKEHYENSLPKGICYLPTTSYPELGEWALPAESSFKFKKYFDNFKTQANFEDIKPFFQGGQWRNFLSKYRESQLIHKKMIFLSEKMKDIDKEEKEPLYLAQCNDAYWHGVFGGLYLPHLRREINSNLIRAEKKCFKEPFITFYDFDCDNLEEIYLKNQYISTIIDPYDGGTLLYISFLPKDICVSDTLTRRKEAYHLRLLEAKNSYEGTKTIHDIFKVKEQGLHKQLVYDNYFRASNRVHIFDEISLEKLKNMAFKPHIVSVDSYGILKVEQKNIQEVLLEHKFLTKKISLNEKIIKTEIEIKNIDNHNIIGVEFNLNLFAPDADDRYFLTEEGEKYHLNYCGAFYETNNLSIIDKWFGIKIELVSKTLRNILIYPIYTVSLSEDGVEKTYQGSSILFYSNIDNNNKFDITLSLEELK